MKNPLLIIDSPYICYINKFALSSGLSYRGHRTEIIYGFLRDVIELADKFESNNMVFCWDSNHSLRRNIYPEYKINRRQEKSEEVMESDMIAFQQFDKLRKEILPDLGFSNVFFQDGYESDDLIASIVLDHSDRKNIVVSSDNDLLQLLDHCSLYNVGKKSTMTKNIFMREYGIKPAQWVDVKTLAGCSTDHVEGIKGVGEKKAIDYLKGKLVSGKTFDKIETYDVDEKEFTRKLVELPFKGTMKCILRNNSFDRMKYMDVCRRNGFNSLLTDKYMDRWNRLFLRREK